MAILISMAFMCVILLVFGWFRGWPRRQMIGFISTMALGAALGVGILFVREVVQDVFWARHLKAVQAELQGQDVPCASHGAPGATAHPSWRR